MNRLYRASKKIIFSWDTEDDSRGNLKLIDFYNGNKHWTFTDRDEAITFLYSLPINKGKTFYFFSHNLEYDICNLFKFHFNLIEKIVWNNFIIYVKLSGKNIIFLDSVNFSFVSLKELGEIIGLKKLEFDPDSIEYIRRDAEIVYQYIVSLQDTLLSEYHSNLNYTLPSTALEVFRRNFLTEEVKPFLSDEVGECYFGGRVEAFFIGHKKGNVIYADVNSMYPLQMKKYFPDTSTMRKVDSIDVAFGFGKFRVLVNDNIPLLPVRVHNKVYFPKGELSGIWTLEEIKAFIELGGELIETEYIIGTDDGGQYFNSFIDHFYNKKKEAKTSFHRNFYKLIMNSLSGKFAQKLNDQELISYEKLKKKNNVNIKKIFFNQVLIESENEKYAENANPLWSAYITAYSRIYLWQQLNYISYYGNLLYCDTDSIIYEGRDDLLEIGKELGQWKIEKFDEIEIIGNKP